jgi:hypothetical protein
MTTISSPLGRVPNRIDPLNAGGASIVLLSIAVSIVGHVIGPERLRIRWTYGTYYGPEFAPAVLVLIAFPLAVAALYLGGRWLRASLERGNEFDTVRAIYDACVLLTLGTLVVVQGVLVAVNTWP